MRPLGVGLGNSLRFIFQVFYFTEMHMTESVPLEPFLSVQFSGFEYIRNVLSLSVFISIREGCLFYLIKLELYPWGNSFPLLLAPAPAAPSHLLASGGRPLCPVTWSHTAFVFSVGRVSLRGRRPAPPSHGLGQRFLLPQRDPLRGTCSSRLLSRGHCSAPSSTLPFLSTLGNLIPYSRMFQA